MNKTFEYKDSHINYDVNGEGITLVLVHGFGEDGKVWDQQVEYLCKFCRVIRMDIPGSGRSTMLRQPIVKIEDYANAIYALLQHEAVEQCVIIGHSMGGYITLAFADKYKDKLQGFGWVNSTAFADSQEKRINRQRGIEHIREYGSYSFLKTMVPNLYADEFKEQHPEVLESHIEAGYAFEKEALIQYYEAMMQRPDRTHVLKAAEVPVLIVAGTEDGPAPLDDVLKQAHLANITSFHLLEGVGHMSMVERAEEVNGYLKEFMRHCFAGRS